jgi:hypothetical protein
LVARIEAKKRETLPAPESKLHRSPNARYQATAVLCRQRPQ